MNTQATPTATAARASTGTYSRWPPELGPLAARLLDGVGGVEHHRAPDPRQLRQGAHVGDERVVAEGDAALAGQDVGVAGLGDLGDDVLHVPGSEKLSLLHVDRLAGRRSRQQQVGLAAEEGGDLQHVHRLRRLRALFGVVHVGQRGQAGDLADLGEHRQRGLQPQAACGAGGGAVRLVERGLIDQGDVQPLGDLPKRVGGLQRVGAALHLAGAGDHRQPLAVADARLTAARRACEHDGVGAHGCWIRQAGLQTCCGHSR